MLLDSLHQECVGNSIHRPKVLQPVSDPFDQNQSHQNRNSREQKEELAPPCPKWRHLEPLRSGLDYSTAQGSLQDVCGAFSHDLKGEDAPKEDSEQLEMGGETCRSIDCGDSGESNY